LPENAVVQSFLKCFILQVYGWNRKRRPIELLPPQDLTWHLLRFNNFLRDLSDVCHSICDLLSLRWTPQCFSNGNFPYRSCHLHFKEKLWSNLLVD